MAEGSYGTLSTIKRASGSLTLSSTAQAVTLGFVPDVIVLCGGDVANGYLESAAIVGSFISSGAEMNAYIVQGCVKFTGNGSSFSLKAGSAYNPIYYLALKF